MALPRSQVVSESKGCSLLTLVKGPNNLAMTLACRNLSLAGTRTSKDNSFGDEDQFFVFIEAKDGVADSGVWEDELA